MPETVAVAELPAMSHTVALNLCFAPGVLMVLSAGEDPARPESASPQVQCTVTGPVYQPPKLALVVGAPAIVGVVLSILIVVEAEVLKPAPLVAVQVSVV